MKQIRFPRYLFDQVRADVLRSSPAESSVIVFAHQARERGATRLLATRYITVPAEEYATRTAFRAIIRSEFIGRMAQQAKKRGESLIFCHSHPTAVEASFSRTDDEGEKALDSFLRRFWNAEHAALLFSKNGCTGRSLNSRHTVSVIVVGKRQESFSDEPQSLGKEHEDFSRQTALFGVAGQNRLHKTKVGIVGLGGTGSAVAQQLAYLGINDFIFVDPDRVERTNLNRLVGATRRDIGKLKVSVIGNSIKKIRPGIKVDALPGNVQHCDIAQRLKMLDFLFSCTDTHGSRAVINQLCFQYLVPTIDMGVSISTVDDAISGITGRVQLLSPDRGCLVCGQLLDSDQVRRDFQSEDERKADPYFIGDGVPQPSVISLNSTMSSLAVSMFMGSYLGIPFDATLQIYDGIGGRVRSAQIEPDSSCIVCSPSRGAIAKGDSQDLPCRK